MMQIVYYSQKSQFLSELKSQEEDVLFITPSPAKADGLRLLLTDKKHDVVTIPKFTASLVEALWPDGEKPQVKRKADLLLIFGILKNKYFPDLGFEEFIQAYNLFSDLRSFTLSTEALANVLEEQPEAIRKAMNLFWQLLEVTGFVDEHGAYQAITEALRRSEEVDALRKTFVFWGFQHLNGQQVDLLKALAIRYDVVVPFPASLREKIKRSDFISWIKDGLVEEIVLPEILATPRGKWLKLNSREFAPYLKRELKDSDQVLLGVSKLSPSHIDLVPSTKLRFKIPHQLIQSELSEYADSLKSWLKGSVSLQSFEDKLNSDQKAFITARKFKDLRVSELYLEALAVIKEMTDEDLTVDQFFLKLMREVTSLNQPRTSFVPVSAEPLSVDLKDMSTLEDLDRKKRVILCIDDRFDEIQSLAQNYTETIQKILATLGPIRRSELELLFKQWEFSDLFAQGDMLVLMSEVTLKHSLVWKRMFSAIELSEVSRELPHKVRGLRDFTKPRELKSFSGSFSASKFQTFLDCPRKFYFTYVDRLFPQVALHKDFDSLVAGSISHRIIELFHERKLKDSDLPDLTKEVMNSYVDEGSLEIPRETFLQKELVFNHRSLNGIQFLRDLEEALGEKLAWTMEKDFKIQDDFAVTGKIDCVGESASTIVLLDFKSTKGSASTSTEVESLSSLQLWTYAHAASRIIPDFDKKKIIIGFVSLDRPSESNLLFSDKEQLDQVKPKKLCQTKVFTEDFFELLEKARGVMGKLAAEIPSSQDFPTRPRTDKACHFCELSPVCLKGDFA